MTGMVWPISCDKWKAPLVNPISPKSDQHEYSPNYINTLPREKVRRINQMINNGGILLSFMKFSQLIQ